jgi:hemoglobin-like flavoprotein
VELEEISIVYDAPIDLHSALTARQRGLVRETFTQLAPAATGVVALLYARLFEVAPTLRPLFHADMHEQGDKLIQALALAVSHLDDLESIAPGVRALGRRHQQYGVAEADFETVGQVLLWALEQSLDARFTAEVGEAWAAVYGVLSGIMKQGLSRDENVGRSAA